MFTQEYYPIHFLLGHTLMLKRASYLDAYNGYLLHALLPNVYHGHSFWIGAFFKNYESVVDGKKQPSLIN